MTRRLTIGKGLDKLGKSLDQPLTFKKELEELGFAKVEQQQFGVPMNPWCKDVRYKNIGAMNEPNNLAALAPCTYAVLCNEIVGWSREDADKMIERARADLQNRKIRGFTTM